MRGNMRGNREKINTGRVWLFLAFFLPFLTMLVLFAVKGIYPFGDRSFLSADLYHQYMPFFCELLRKVRGGESLWYSFRLGIGSNFFALFVYYLASPFHILSLLVPGDHLIDFIGYMIVVKVGLCGLTCCIYLREHFHTKEAGCVLFSCFYALSGFMAAYNYNIMWVDCVILLPLIVLGLERLVKEGRCGLYCITLALSIWTNYYISIMICIFLVLYFGLLLLTSKRRLRSVGLFALFSLLAGGMAAALLVPEVCAILQTDFGDVSIPDGVESYFSILDVLARHCVCVQTERGLDHWPNIYCGSAVMMLLPMYLMNSRISVREKFLRLLLAGFFLLSFGTNVLDFFWHGMNFPDSLPARQSFIYIFLVLVMCYEAYLRVEEVEERQIVFGYALAACFLLFCEKFVEQEDFETGVMLLTFGFVTVYAVLLYLYRTREDHAVRRGIAIVAFAAVVAESGINTWDTSIATTSRSTYLGQIEDYQALYDVTKEREESFYRLEKFSRKTKNDGTLAGYPSASIFSSTMNSSVMDMYKKLGMRYSKVFYGFDGATALTAALLNVNYMFGAPGKYENSLYNCLAQSGEVSLYACSYTLPFGYVAPEGFDLPDNSRAIGLQNELVEELGVSGALFTDADAHASGDDVTLTAEEGGIYYAILTAGGTGKVTYIGGGTEEETFSDLKNGSILYLGYLEKGQSITLTNGDDGDETPKIQADIYRMDEEVLSEALSVLSKQHLENVEWESDSLSGDLSLESPGRLILSIPYEDGWRVTINGEEVQGESFGGCLMAFDLEAGDYRIEMHYVPKGLYAGALISIVSILLFAVLQFFSQKPVDRIP
jgi:uncharacterized membrane protein YfhO